MTGRGNEELDGLGDERIGRMRRGVMHQVDADVARRGRRARRVVGGAAAACVVVVIGGLGTSLLVAPDDGGDAAGADSSADVAAAPQQPEDAAGGLRAEVEPDGATAQELPDVEQSERQVVTTGSATVRVSAPAEVADALAAWVGRAGGRVDQRAEYTSDESGTRGRVTSASLVVRVPADAVDRTVAQLRTYGTVTGLDVAREDVTDRVADLDARIRSLTTSVDRLLEILADADDASDLLAVERSLSERQADLESLQAQRRAVREQVDLSTLSVELVTRDGAESVDPGGFVGGLQSGWNALVAVVNTAVETFGAVLPWLGVALLGWLLWRLVAWLRRRR